MNILRRSIALCLLVLLLSGCNGQTTEISPADVTFRETMPRLTYGEMESEALQVLPWDSGRCEATSLNAMAETELGFYQVCSRWLYYADKTDLSNWVLVCGDPACSHQSGCDATIDCGRIILSGDRIYYEAHPQSVPGGELTEGGGFILASKNLNGTFHQTEYVLEDMLTAGRSASSSLLLQDQWLCQKFELSPGGALEGKLYRVTGEGVQLLASLDDFDPMNTPPSLMDAAYQYALNGDRYFTTGILEGSQKTLYRYWGDGLAPLDATDLTLRGSYISGNTLRYFLPGQGYFDRDLKSGEEVFLASSQLENSIATILLPNCILESTLLLPASMQSRTPGMTHALEFFDGKVWHSVELPDWLKGAGSSVFLTPLAVTSDSILLCCMNTATAPNEYSMQLYWISLTAGQKQLEFFAEIRTPSITG